MAVRTIDAGATLPVPLRDLDSQISAALHPLGRRHTLEIHRAPTTLENETTNLQEVFLELSKKARAYVSGRIDSKYFLDSLYTAEGVTNFWINAVKSFMQQTKKIELERIFPTVERAIDSITATREMLEGSSAPNNLRTERALIKNVEVFENTLKVISRALGTLKH